MSKKYGPSRQYTKGCWGKVAHSTLDKAKTHISNNHPHTNMSAYFCPYCKFWHVGHKK